MSNIIIAAILAIILFAAFSGAIKHFKGEGGCCGGGGSTVKEPDKELAGPVIKTKVFEIEGMHCENCVNRVKRAITELTAFQPKSICEGKRRLSATTGKLMTALLPEI